MSLGKSTVTRLRTRLRSIYKGHSARAYRVRYGSLLFDIVTILYIVVTSFTPHTVWVEASRWMMPALWEKYLLKASPNSRAALV